MTYVYQVADRNTSDRNLLLAIVCIWTAASIFILTGATMFPLYLGWFGLVFTAWIFTRLARKAFYGDAWVSFYEVLKKKIALRKKSDVLYLEELPIPMMKISKSGHISQSNDAARKLLGVRDDESPHLGDVIEGIGRSVSQWVEATQNRKNPLNTEFVKAKRSKARKQLQVQLSPSVDGTHGCLCLIQDVTELKTLEAQFVQSQKMEAIGQLAGGIAHDFNNLLTAISGYCDLLMLRHEKGDSDHNDLMQISSNANRAAALVGQLLAYSRNQTMQMRAVQVNDVLGEITHLLNRLVGEKISLVFDRAKGLPPAYVDSRRLEQVIMNLVVNARDAMPTGGEICIQSRLEEFSRDEKRDDVNIFAGKYISIDVKDEGQGIQSANLKKVFEPFFSTKEVGQGTGLGLSMVYGIVKQTGGYIFVESTVGRGSRFTLLLPVSEREVMVNESKTKMVEKSNSISGLRILLVEDEDPVRAFSKRALQGQGAIVSEANCGTQALDVLKETDQNFDVIVTDVVMPDMDGPTWVNEAGAQLASTKLIFVSGYTEEAFQEEWSQFGEALFLPKPYSLKDLVSTVSKLAAD